MPVSIEFDSDNSIVILCDLDGQIAGDRRARFQLQRNLSAFEQSEGTYHIEIDAGEEEEVVRRLIELLEFLNIQTSIERTAGEVVQTYLDEQESFKNFSEHARNIWAGTFEPPELQTFANVLSETWPTRALYPLQLLASFHLAYSQNACNFSVPGAGKTSTVLGAYTYLNSLDSADAKYVNKMLVVGPLSCFKPWEDEFEICLGKSANSFRISGESSKREIERTLRSLADEVQEIELILISYQSLSIYLQELIALLDRPGNQFMTVLDEAHRAKSTEGGLWARSVLSIASHSNSRVVLTGTPAPNGFQDIHNLFEFIWPNKNVIGYAPGHLKAMTANPYDSRRSVVVQNIAPYFIRISKADLGLDPPIDRPPTLVEMGSSQRAIYEYIEQSYVDYFMRESSHPRNIFVRSRQIRLLQAATNPGLLSSPISEAIDSEVSDTLFVDDSEIFSQIEDYLESEVPPKYEVALQLIQRHLEAGEKVVVWSYYIGNILGFKNFLSDHSINSKVLYGAIEPSSTDPAIETRETIISGFHKQDCNYRVIIANPYAVGESISLHKACQNAIYMERNFNAAVYLQSKDRTHRYGMPDNTTATYDYLVTSESVEQTVNRRLDEKVSLMMDVVESRDIPLLDLSRNAQDTDEDDIRAIIQDYNLRANT